MRASWDDFERAILAAAEQVEDEARRRRRDGDHRAAADLLTQLMADNVAAMLDHLEGLIAGLG